MKRRCYAFTILFLIFFTYGSAQEIIPDSIHIQLTGPSSSPFKLPAQMIIKQFGPGSSTFQGSNGKTETGYTELGYYSEQVETGAIFFPILGQHAGFPARQSSDPVPNRLGGSSFLAIKTNEDGNRKYWMTISVGAFKVNGAGNLNWEYHFRYFYDTKTGVEKGEMGTVTNSGVFTSTPVEFIVDIVTIPDIITNYKTESYSDNFSSPLTYPNPADNFVIVNINHGLRKFTLTVSDIHGNIHTSKNYPGLKAGGTVIIPTENLKDGIYMFNTEDENGMTIGRNRIIINHFK